MTIEELSKHFIDKSPFKFKGDSKNLFLFKNDTYSIDNGKQFRYVLSKVGDNFIFNDGGLIPLFQNIKLKISDTESVLLNLDEQRLKSESYRSKDAFDGFLT
jgi:hypothetical protein